MYRKEALEHHQREARSEVAPAFRERWLRWPPALVTLVLVGASVALATWRVDERYRARAAPTQDPGTLELVGATAVSTPRDGEVLTVSWPGGGCATRAERHERTVRARCPTPLGAAARGHLDALGVGR